MSRQFVPSFHGVAVRGINKLGPMALMYARILTKGDGLTTEREPTNPHDARAIRVFHGMQHIGYIGREFAFEIAPWMDRGIVFTTHMTGVHGAWAIVSLVPISRAPREVKKSKAADREKEAQQ